VEILSDKTVESYRRVISRRGIDPEEFVMVGNSLRSDILPVVQMGARAVHIPYHLTWSHEHVDDDSLPAEGWYRLERIAAIGKLLASIDEGPPRGTRGTDRHKLQSRPDRKTKRESGPLSSG
jgi:putative hydrolase of the HAD superfamily